ncbi:TetR/AcrR family transcriptional regulator [Paenibacillus motobuensis]|uniref:TetR/AcrR family transcriptional regulator n=1 Tax=Paenibacillus lutimineralis TaxID=2707005 RepID=A0A3S9V2L4_9BACL|nr:MULTISPECIES: TetR/AcrR family transcriptional regulator [Paenibacillus]AZS16811.1 TetR/AcrR family transcriptional regulator [Paenibacillus lutimineralis]MCM3039011.1 TetR/AcrR family transcriptional regulator [Paenibacillus lutimineralis]MCM3646115.1 TetR/AcrR family transcriptional regulator [Paenibacillus motobuensis]
MARRAVEQELSRERIMDAARHLFITKGYRGISMRSIGQHLGYSHGSLYYHFKEKAELFYAIVVQDFNHLTLLCEQVTKHPVVDGLTKTEELMLEFIKFGLDHPHQYEIMFMLRDEEILSYCRAEQSKCFDKFKTIVQRFLKEEQHPLQQNPSFPLSMFLGIHGFISFYIQDRLTFDEIMPAAVGHVKMLSQSIYRLTS